MGFVPLHLLSLLLVFAILQHGIQDQHNIQDIKTVQTNLLFAAFPKTVTATRYIFNEKTFGTDTDKERHNMLVDIANEKGSLQSNDVLLYEEYEHLDKLPEKVKEKIKVNQGKRESSEKSAFEEIKGTLDSKIREFGTEVKNEEFLKNGVNHYEVGKESLPEIDLEFIVRCKRFIRDLWSEGGAASWLDLFSFMKSEKEAQYKVLEKIYQISKIQSKKLDNLVNKAIYDEHVENKMKNEGEKRSPFNRAVIVGAGPIGLYSALQFFVAGMSVVIVNDRKEYIRRRFNFLDQKWMTQLRFFLGTKFDELFIGNTAPAEILWRDYGEIGMLNANNIEKFMKERLLMLEIYVKSQESTHPPLQLLYETAFNGIQMPTADDPKYLAILSKTHPRIEFDVLVCAGGANDRIRDKYLLDNGKPEQLTDAKYYSVVIFNKRNPAKGVYYDDRTGFFTVKMNDKNKNMKAFLQKQQFDKMIKESKFLSPKLRSEYASFTDMLTKEGQLIVRLFENKQTIHIASITPLPMVAFFEALEKEKKKTPGNEELIKDLRERIDRKYSVAVFEFTISEAYEKKSKEKPGKFKKYTGETLVDMDENGRITLEESKKNKDPNILLDFDEHTVNTSTFKLSINSVKDAVKVLKKKHGDPPAIVMAVGDANTSVHFMTSSGLSSGRLGVEGAAQAIRDYHNNQESADDLYKNLRKKLNSVRHRVMKKVLDMKLLNKLEKGGQGSD